MHGIWKKKLGKYPRTITGPFRRKKYKEKKKGPVMRAKQEAKGKSLRGTSISGK